MLDHLSKWGCTCEHSIQNLKIDGTKSLHNYDFNIVKLIIICDELKDEKPIVSTATVYWLVIMVGYGDIDFTSLAIPFPYMYI